MTPYMGSLAIFSFLFAPKGWALCNGQILAISQNQALFSLLGTTYGGNGVQTFALPNLQGRAAIHYGSGFSYGQVSGQSATTLLAGQLPSHTHTFSYGAPCSTDVGTLADPTNHFPAATASNTYGTTADVNLGFSAQNPANLSTDNKGGSQPVSLMQPYLTLNFCIALQGIFPSRN